MLNKPYNTQLSEMKTRACLHAHKIRENVSQSVDGSNYLALSQYHPFAVVLLEQQMEDDEPNS